MDLLDQDGLSHRFRLLLRLSRERSAFAERHDAARLEASRRGVGMGVPLDALAACLEIQQAADVAAARGEPGWVRIYIFCVSKFIYKLHCFYEEKTGTTRTPTPRSLKLFTNRILSISSKYLKKRLIFWFTKIHWKRYQINKRIFKKTIECY